jgi:RNA polymerase sigma-70 factor (ECF subfamily)
MPVTDAAMRPQETRNLDNLLSDVAAGSRDAFEALYRETAPRLFGICLRVLPDRGEAEDVLQEVFTRVWNKASLFEPSKASAMTWLAMVARNKAIDRLRSNPAAVKLTALDLADELPDHGTSPSQAAERSADRVQLDACLDELEPRRKVLIREAFFDGSTYEELAERTGSPLGTVKSWIRRGLAQLRVCLER